MITQLKSSYELVNEGKKMHHCVGSYIKEAEEGRSFFYKVTAPERCTLQIIVRGSQVYINGFKLACNKDPSEESSWEIRNWIDGQV